MSKNTEIANLKVGLSLDSQSFTKQIASAKKDVSYLSKEFETVSKAIDTAGDKTTAYGNALNAGKQGLSAMQKQLQLQEKSFDNLSVTIAKQKQRYEELPQAINDAKQSLQQLESSGKKNTEEYNKQSEALKKLETEYTNKGDVIQKNIEKLQKYSTDIDKTTSNIDKMEGKISKLSDEFKINSMNVDITEKSYEGLGGKLMFLDSKMLSTNSTLDKQKGSFTSLQSILKDQEKELQRIGDTLGETSSEWIEQQQAISKTKRELDTTQQAISKTENTLDQLTNEVKDTAIEFERLGTKTTTLDGELKEIGQAADLAESKFELLNSELSGGEGTLKGVVNELNRMKTALENNQAKATAYTKEISKIESNLDKLENSQKEVTNEMKSVASELQTATQRYGANSSEVQELTTKLNRLKDTYSQNESAIDSFNNELRENQTQMNRVQTESNNIANSMRQLPLDTISSKLQSVGGGFTNVGMALTPLSVGLTAIGAKALEVGVSFDRTMSQVSAVTGATGTTLDSLKNKAMDLGNSTKWSSSQVAEGFTYMGMAGWNAEQMLSGIEGVLNLASAGGLELGEAADIVTDGLTALGLTAKDCNDFVDMMGATITSSNTSVSLMGETLKYAAPVAGSLGVEMNDLSLAIGLMGNAGIKGSQAGTALRSGMTNLVSPTEKAYNAMEKYGVQVKLNSDETVDLSGTMDNLRNTLGDLTASEQAAAISAIFGKEAMSGWAAVINATEGDYTSLTNEINNSTSIMTYWQKSMIDSGKSAEETQTHLNSLNDIFKDTKDTADNLAISGNDLGVMMTALASDSSIAKEDVDTLLNAFKNIISPSEQAAEAMEEYGVAVSRHSDGTLDTVGTMESLRNALNGLTEEEQKAVLSKMGLGDSIGVLNEVLGLTPNELNAIAVAMEETDGKSKTLAETMQNNLGGSIDTMKSSLETALYKGFEALQPLLLKIVENITKLADWFTKLDSSTQETIVNIGALVVGITPLLIGLGSLITTVGSVVGTLATLKGALSIGSVIGLFAGPAGIALAVASLGLLATHVGNSDSALEMLQDKFGGFGYFVGRVCEGVAGIVEYAIGNLKLYFQYAQDLVDAMLDGFGGKTIADANKAFAQGKKELQQDLKDAISGVKSDAVAMEQIELKMGVEVQEEFYTAKAEIETRLEEMKKNLADGIYVGADAEQAQTEIEELTRTLDKLDEAETQVDLYARLEGTLNELSIVEQELDSLESEREIAIKSNADTNEIERLDKAVEDAKKKVDTLTDEKIVVEAQLEDEDYNRTLAELMENVTYGEETINHKIELETNLEDVTRDIDKFETEKEKLLQDIKLGNVDNSEAAKSLEEIETKLTELTTEKHETELLLKENDAEKILQERQKLLDELTREPHEVNMNVEADTTKAVQEIEQAAEKANTSNPTVQVDADTSQANEKVNAVKVEAEKVEVKPIDADITQATAEVQALENATNSTSATINVSTDKEKVTQSTTEVKQQAAEIDATKPVVVYDAETAQASKNVTGLKENMSDFDNKNTGKTKTTTFNAETAQASKNVTGLKTNVADYVSRYTKTFTTTFSVVTKYSTQGTPTAQSQGMKVGGRNISDNVNTISNNVVSPKSIDNISRQAQEIQTLDNSISSFGASARNGQSTPINLDYFNNGINPFENLENTIKRVNNQLDILNKKSDMAYGQEKINYLKQQVEELAKQRELQGYLIGNATQYAQELKKTLNDNGIEVNENNQIINQKEKMLELEKELSVLNNIQIDTKKVEYAKDTTNWTEKEVQANKDKVDAMNKVNEAQTENQKQQIENQKNNINSILKTMDEYEKTVTSTIQSAESEWYDLEQQIKDTQQAIREANKEQANFSTNIQIDKSNASITDLSNQLSILDRQIEKTFGQDKVKLIQEKNKVLKEQQDELHKLANSYREQAEVAKEFLNSKGFTFDTNGEVLNWEHLEQLKGFDGYDFIKEQLDEYIKLTKSEVPKLSAEWWELNDSIVESNGEIHEAIQSLQELKDIEVQFTVDIQVKQSEAQISKITNQLNALDRDIDKATGLEKETLLAQKNALLQQQQQEVHKVAEAYRTEAKSIGEYLNSKGFQIGVDGVLNFDHLENFKNSENFEYIQQQVEKYTNLMLKDVPALSEEWWDLQDIIEGNKDTVKEFHEEQKQMLETARELVKELQFDYFNHQLNQAAKATDELNDKLNNTSGFGSQISLLNQKLTLIEKEKQAQDVLTKQYETQAATHKSFLQQNGFKFDNNGMITNLNQLEKLANDETYDKISNSLKEYNNLVMNDIPNSTENYTELNKEIQDVYKQLEQLRKEQFKMIQEAKLQEVQKEYKDLSHELAILQKQMEHTSGTNLSGLLDRQISIMEKQKEAIANQYKEIGKIQSGYKSELVQFGFKFDNNGDILDYAATLEKISNTVDNFDEVQQVLDDYFKLQNDELPNLQLEWLEMENTIKDALNEKLQITANVEKQLTDIYKKQVQDRIDLINKELNAKLDALNKQKQAYNDTRTEQKYQDSYEEQLQKTLDIQKQLDILAKDTSLSGQKKYQDLLNQLKDEQKALENLVQDKIDTDVNNMFDKESDRLSEDVEKQIENLENQFNDAKIAELVAKALGSGVFQDIEGNVSSLEDALVNFSDEAGDLFGVLGNTIKDELIGNLQIAIDTISDLENVMGRLDMNTNTVVPYGIDYSSARYSPSQEVQSVNNTSTSQQQVNISFNSELIKVEGSVNSENIQDLEKLTNEIKDKIVAEIVANIH